MKAMRRLRAARLRALSCAALALAIGHAPAAGQERVVHPLGDFEHVVSTNGLLVAAPHGTFDAYTDALAIAVAARLGAGYVVARHFTPHRVRINVNRPTEGAHASCANESRTDRAAEVYDAYLDRVRRAAGTRPPGLYIEIHGNSNPRTTRHLEVATVGVSGAQAQGAKDAFSTLLEQVRERVPTYPELELLIEPHDRLHFTASCAKKLGILGSDAVVRGIHIELPRAAREGDALPASAMLIADLVRALLRAQP